MALCGWYTKSVCSNWDPETYRQYKAAYNVSAFTWRESWAGWVSDMHLCTFGRESIEFISFKSAVMWCGVVVHVVLDVLGCSAFKTWLTTCPVTKFHISEEDSSSVPLLECQILLPIASQVGLHHLVKSLIKLGKCFLLTCGRLFWTQRWNIRLS